MHLSHWQLRKLMKSQANWKVKGHTHDEGSRADVRTCRCVPLTWQRCATILYRSSEMHAQKQEKKWVNTTKDREVDWVWGIERERHTTAMVKNKSSQRWIKTRMRGRGQPQWTWKTQWLMEDEVGLLGQKVMGYLSLGQQDVGYDVWQTAAQHEHDALLAVSYSRHLRNKDKGIRHKNVTT